MSRLLLSRPRPDPPVSAHAGVAFRLLLWKATTIRLPPHSREGRKAPPESLPEHGGGGLRIPPHLPCRPQTGRSVHANPGQIPVFRLGFGRRRTCSAGPCSASSQAC